jgi:FkbM family methyltransferase
MKLSGLFKPEYYYQPNKLLERLQRHHSSGDEFLELDLPWKMPIRVRPQEEHGRILRTLGVVDLPVTETLWRLTDLDECAVDVGANIGCMTAVLAARVAGAGEGRVICFEAHPEIFLELQHNLQLWRQAGPQAQIEAYAIAVSNHSGSVTLAIEDTFTTNRGLASVVADLSEKASHFTVASISLDQHFANSERIHVLKVDVEGHELQVFQGADRLLQAQRIRDCIFEEHELYPTPVTTLLESYGYQVWRIDREFWQPTLVDPTTPISENRWLPTSFLATCDPERAKKRMLRSGWNCLQYRGGVKHGL